MGTLWGLNDLPARDECSSLHARKDMPCSCLVPPTHPTVPKLVAYINFCFSSKPGHLISAIPTMSHQNHFSSWWVLLPCCISVMFGCSSCWWRFLPLFIILLHYCTFRSPLRRFWSGCWCQTCPLVVLRERILSVINPTSEEFWIVIFLNLLDLIGKYDVMQNLLMCIS